jgi:formylglycine-generating enzyme required for sulfatase activity
LNNYQAAIADYNQAINIDPHDNVAQMGWAIAQKKLNQSLITTSDIKENIDIKSNINQNLVYKIFEFETVTVDKKGEIIKRENKQAKYFTEILPNDITLDMVEIPGGSFIMGSPETEIGRYKDEGPQHEVIIQTFYMGKYPVTQAQYEVVMNDNPSKFARKNRPVEKVTWQQAKEFCTKLSKLTGKKYFLPSEAQWEYAARAGTTTAFHYGETITSKLANYAGNTYNQEPKGEWRKEPTDVGIFPPNAFGLYDIHGNVWEWCEDEWHENYEGMPIDGSAWILSAPKNKVLRGGSWNYDPGSCRVANRTCLNLNTIINGIGFRVCCLIENADNLVESEEQSVNQQFIINPKYIRLEQLLANQQWKQADQETARVMLKIAEREEEAFLNIEAIDNFPCDDLEIIDRLWLKYSNGLFGFSIQLNIWSEYDNKLDYETECNTKYLKSGYR